MGALQGVSSTTEKLTNAHLGTKGIGALVAAAWRLAEGSVVETLPEGFLRGSGSGFSDSGASGVSGSGAGSGSSGGSGGSGASGASGVSGSGGSGASGVSGAGGGGLMGLREALLNIHFPQSPAALKAAEYRLKFEELLGVQLDILSKRSARVIRDDGFLFPRVGEYFTRFWGEKLPFELTDAQKRVVKEIRADTVSGRQMNRLLEGDVGSGKTLVALIAMLLAADNGFQSCIMAPTEILARQHFASISKMVDGLGIRVGILTGASKAAERREVFEGLVGGETREKTRGGGGEACGGSGTRTDVQTGTRTGDKAQADAETGTGERARCQACGTGAQTKNAEGRIDILIGTHALIEDRVRFDNLGLVVIDEQHRFGVEQRARLWTKNAKTPHILVMTATPIPRTLAMTLYGDLEISVIDQLPPGRKPIKTYYKTDADRLAVWGFLKREIAAGRQAYVVYPLIEGSEKMDYKDLTDGFESIERDFPKPEYQTIAVHGRMKATDKQAAMEEFKSGRAQIMVATSVIEVGVDVPNATVMVIESAERFGLSQLHQLRGRVGRGGEQSHCILMSGVKLSKDARARLAAMVETTDGFRLAELDMKLRGAGDIAGTQQSGMAFDLRIADLSRDGQIIEQARRVAEGVLEADPLLDAPENLLLRQLRDRYTPRTPKDFSNIS
jgi:ATP-dependent DNA helicase RecG